DGAFGRVAAVLAIWQREGRLQPGKRLGRGVAAGALVGGHDGLAALAVADRDWRHLRIETAGVDGGDRLLVAAQGERVLVLATDVLLDCDALGVGAHVAVLDGAPQAVIDGRVDELGVPEPQAEVAPKWLFLAPVEGVRRLLDRIELPIEAFDLIEINEAFAAQTLADGRALGFDWDKVNVNGGAIALGHPIGASGARIVATLLHELQRREGRYGLATLCLGGGGSVAMAVERV
ncbi:MAG: acetyl-CoA C-acetyltransferase, partial [Chloroflexota bacterium]|nr:acetyl-CoA C-acetyltransferase [Chloroflexota bacterium]